jgi:hypothetical protein
MIKVGDTAKTKNGKIFKVKDIKVENEITFYLDEYIYRPEFELEIDKTVTKPVNNNYGTQTITQEIPSRDRIGGKTKHR